MAFIEIKSVLTTPMSEEEEGIHRENYEGAELNTAPGSITVVRGDSNDNLPRSRSAKRRRGEYYNESEPSSGEEARKLRDVPEVDERVPIEYTNEKDLYRDEEQFDARTQVERLLDAKRRRRRMGRHVAEEQIREDLEDVKRFLSLPEADRDAYLSIYEYDGNEEEVIDGLAKLSSLGIRTWIAYNRPAKDYEFAALALDNPQVKDALASAWSCLDIAKIADKKPIKAAVALGHVGDVLLNTGMSVYQAVNTRADDRDRILRMERKKQTGVQSVFDLSSNGSNEAHSSGSSSGAGHSQLQSGSAIIDQI